LKTLTYWRMKWARSRTRGGARRLNGGIVTNSSSASVCRLRNWWRSGSVNGRGHYVDGCSVLHVNGEEDGLMGCIYCGLHCCFVENYLRN
jgi:hypothetical protein